jgi:hypothetical protein
MLYLAPLSTSMIRVAVAVALIYIAYRVFATSREIMAVEFPIVGHMRSWMVTVGASASCLIGVALFVGAWTQPLAILAAMIATKHAYWSRVYPGIFPLSTGAYVLLTVMSLSLIFSGAGAFAFDLPL